VARGRVMVVTGGSRGIGAATARLAAGRGYRVAIAYATNDALAESVVAGIRRAGGEATACAADVADPGAVEELFQNVDKVFGRVHALVNSAGVRGELAEIRQLDVNVLHRVIAVNVLGTFHCVKEAVRRMAKTCGGQGGAIVNVSSEAARFGGNRLSAYAAAKAGVNAMTIGIARELAPEGIRINAVSPAIIDTDQHAGLTPEHRAEIERGLPMGRMGTAEEVAETILWLLSDQASYITGAIVPVHGGR